MTSSWDRPLNAAGTCPAAEELTDVERRARAVRHGGQEPPAPAVPALPYTLDEPLEGPVFEVRTESVDGMHEVRAVTGPPGTEEPDEEARTVLRSLVRSMLDLLGHESGPALTRVALTSQGPRVASCDLGGRTPREDVP